MQPRSGEHIMEARAPIRRFTQPRWVSINVGKAAEAAGSAAGTILGPRRVGIVIVDQDPLCSAPDVLILARPQRPDEGADGDQAENDRKRGEQEDDVHRRLLTRSALSVTTSDEPDIASAATKGFTRPIIAAGAATRL